MKNHFISLFVLSAVLVILAGCTNNGLNVPPPRVQDQSDRNVAPPTIDTIPTPEPVLLVTFLNGTTGRFYEQENVPFTIFVQNGCEFDSSVLFPNYPNVWNATNRLGTDGTRFVLCDYDSTNDIKRFLHDNGTGMFYDELTYRVCGWSQETVRPISVCVTGEGYDDDPFEITPDLGTQIGTHIFTYHEEPLNNNPLLARRPGERPKGVWLVEMNP